MSRLKKLSVCVFAVVGALLLVVGTSNAKNKNYGGAKNIIFMVPDGMGLADVTAARIFANGPDGDRLDFEKLSVIGYQSTHSANSTVTDSAAAASAWASGEKFNNGEISCHDDDGDGACDGDPVPTILDIAKNKGKSTGLVATSDITHATPAAFGANVHSRKCEEEIARQYITRKINVLLGGGIATNRSPCALAASDTDDSDGSNYLDDVLQAYSTAGYTVVETASDLDTAVVNKKGKILGLFKDGGKTQELFRVDSSQTYPEKEPTLAEMTQAALTVLEKNRKGFFLMVEGSQIDWAGHANDVDGVVAETLAFNEAYKVIADWVGANKSRKSQTLIVVVADHETGGFAINGPYGTLSEQGDIVQDGWTSTNHTAVDTIIWAQGPNSAKFGQALDNSDLYLLMKEALK